jgi:hypothetical protein
MKKIMRMRNVLLLVALLAAIWIIQFSYRTNNFCAPGDSPIQSEADAIAVTKKKIVKNPSFSSDSFGSAPDFVEAVERTENCCRAIRSRNVLGLVFWDVHLAGRMKPIPGPYPGMASHYPTHSVVVLLSNCGLISGHYKFID